jgi:uncharacterized protein (TIGR02145 family)
MAENLNYNASDSKCYDDDDDSCAQYGRLYDWATAMAIDASCNAQDVADCDATVTPKHQGVCPDGWHIPSNAEWDALYRFADGTNGTGSPYNSLTAGKHLKASSGWAACSASGSSYSCLDTYGFAALPGGGGSDGSFYFVGNYGYWWSASENTANNAYFRYMYYSSESAYWGSGSKDSLFSVRCLQD